MSENQNENQPVEQEKPEEKESYLEEQRHRRANASQREKRASTSKREKNPILAIILIVGLIALAGFLVFMFMK